MRKQRYLSDEELQQIKQYRDKGKPISWIARKLKRTYKAIWRHARKSTETSSKPARGKPPICTEETIRLAQSALEAAQAEPTKSAHTVGISLDVPTRNFVQTLAQFTSCDEAAVVAKIFQRGLVETREALRC